MRLLSRTKEKKLTLKKARFVKLSLSLFIPILVFSFFAHLSGQSSVAYAASCPGGLSNGSSGTWVQRLQGSLNWQYNTGEFSNSPYNFSPTQQPDGYYGLTADGNFGSHTEAAVKDFQHAFGLSVDGQVGPQTWGNLGFCNGNGSTGSISGGGCSATSLSSACVAVNPSGYIIADGYTRSSGSVAMIIYLVDDGNLVDKETFISGASPFPSGTHIGGATSIQVEPGHTWQTFTMVRAQGTGNWTGGGSFVQFS